MQDLRSKLLKAGLVDKKAKRKADQEVRKKKKRKGGIRRAEADSEKKRQKQQADFEAKRKAENREREAQRRAEFLRKERLLRVTYIAESRAIRERGWGERKFYFATRSGVIKRFDVSQELGVRLELGQAAIVERPFSKAEPFGIVPREKALKILDFAPEYVLFFNKEPVKQKQERPLGPEKLAKAG